MPILPTRPPNWDWVTAVHGCSVDEIFDTLQGLARLNVNTRNAHLGTPEFDVRDTNGGFSVGRQHGEITNRVFFGITEDRGTDLQIRVSGTARSNSTHYEVKLDADGHCKLYDTTTPTTTPLDPWQVLRLALEPALFRSR